MLKLNHSGMIMLLMLLASQAAVRSEPVVIDFESYELGGAAYWNAPEVLVIPDAGGSGTTVTIEAGSDNRIYDLFLFGGDPAFTGQALLDWDWAGGVNDEGTTILFDRPVANFSLAAGDWGSDDDTPLEIQAFDADDQLLGADSADWDDDSFPPFVILAITAEGIRKIHFSSGGTFQGSIFIDDLTFTPTPTAVQGDHWGRLKTLYR